LYGSKKSAQPYKTYKKKVELAVSKTSASLITGLLGKLSPTLFSISHQMTKNQKNISKKQGLAFAIPSLVCKTAG